MSNAPDEKTYRRGLVMGLTMAEVMVLVVFALLLLLGLENRRATVAGDGLRQLWQEAGFDSSEIPDDFDILVAAVRAGGDARHPPDVAPPDTQEPAAPGRPEGEGSSEGKAPEKSTPTQQEIEQIGRDAIEAFGANTIGIPATQATEMLIHLGGILWSNRRQQFGSAEMWAGAADTALDANHGNGLVYPPCATTPDGRPAYIFTAFLFDEYLVLNDRDVEPVRPLPAAFELLAAIPRGVQLSDAAFRESTAALFDWSERQGCRFFVFVEDRTGPDAKAVYKHRLRTVEQHFYKFESIDGNL